MTRHSSVSSLKCRFYYNIQSSNCTLLAIFYATINCAVLNQHLNLYCYIIIIFSFQICKYYAQSQSTYTKYMFSELYRTTDVGLPYCVHENKSQLLAQEFLVFLLINTISAWYQHSTYMENVCRFIVGNQQQKANRRRENIIHFMECF